MQIEEKKTGAKTMDTKQVTVKLGADTKQTKPTNTKKNNKTQPSVDLNKEFQRAKEENITRLNLSKNNITVVPPNIKDLGNLVELYLYGNKIAVLPPEIGALIHLQTLALNENQVSHDLSKRSLFSSMIFMFLAQHFAGLTPKSYKIESFRSASQQAWYVLRLISFVAFS